MVYEQSETYYVVMPEYGKQRLLMYAQSLDELAGHYQPVNDKNTVEEEWQESDRKEMLAWQQIHENRSVVSGQLSAISGMLKGLANEAYRTSKSMEKHKRQIAKVLTENGLEIQDLYTVANQNGYLEIGMTLRSAHKDDLYEVSDIAGFLSKLLHNHMDAAPSMPEYVSEEYVNLVFREEVRFLLTSGVAKAIKEGEVLSGDNFTMEEIPDGSYIAAICDGMGSGESAGKDSEMVIELLEQFLEAGVTKEMAAGMINDLLLARSAETKTATLDLFTCNLYSGEVQFLKMGAAPSFIKSGTSVEMITEHSLPLGLLAGSPQRKDTETGNRFLSAGDMIVLMSDGITDSMAQAYGDQQSYEGMRKFLAGYEFISCKDLANQILGMAIMALDGYIQDDMTVIVLQLEER